MTTPGALQQRACRERQRAGIRLPNWDERFNARLLPVGDCLEWQGARDPNGYGRVSREGTMVLAHRAAMERLLGPIPSELNVRHSCDNPPCCKPGHLFPCPTADNVADMHAKGRGRSGETMRLHPERAARGDRHGTRTHPEAYPRGEQHPVSKLTADQVAEIRARYKGRGRGPSQEALAREYGVNQATIWALLSGRTWQ